MTRLAVMLSGRGSNFLAIHDAVRSGRIPAAEIVAVISNKPDAPGLSRGRELGYDCCDVDHRQFASREEHEAELLRLFGERKVDFVLLAGYMRLLSPRFVNHFRHRILNIHPSLLPAFPGVDAQAQAIAHGVKVAGCTVHLVDESLDGGPILVQRSVNVLDEDDSDSLAARILEEEHEAYVEAVRKVCGGFRVEGRRVFFD
ncbi:MAG TPA: phosphoribosylglycinamide formyltransferase [Thermoanaerobaculia bacterium]|nr:phosphoribosylglycinamide formyltransferase [Thermoanaerobaculia bacterium]